MPVVVPEAVITGTSNKTTAAIVFYALLQKSSTDMTIVSAKTIMNVAQPVAQTRKFVSMAILAARPLKFAKTKCSPSAANQAKHASMLLAAQHQMQMLPNAVPMVSEMTAPAAQPTHLPAPTELQPTQTGVQSVKKDAFLQQSH